MKKLINIGVLLLIFSTTARAAPTLFEHRIDIGRSLFAMDGLAASTDWEHSNPFPGTSQEYHDAVTAGRIIAALTIGVSELVPADDEVEVVFTDRFGAEHTLGLLDAGVGEFEQTFELDPDWLDGVDVVATLNWTHIGDSPSADLAAIMTSTLSVIWDDGVAAHAPAPGALLLGSMGMGLVGWLRRRRAL